MAHAHARNTSLRNDPSKTLPIRRQFVRDIAQRFRNIRGVVRTTVGYENDAFGLTANENPLDPIEAYDFPTDGAKINAFVEDLKRWIRNHVIAPPPPGVMSQLRSASTVAELQAAIEDFDHWTKDYITRAYIKSSNVAGGRLMQEGVSTSNLGRDALLETRTSLRTLAKLYARTFENLRNIGDEAAETLRQELTKGFARGENPKKIANRLTDELRDLQKTRAETLARTEVMNAAGDAALDRYEREGVELVGHGEWLTAMDADVCPFCRRLSGEIFRIDEFRATRAVQFRGQVFRLDFPAHPNGRCHPTPVIGDPGDLTPLSERVPGELVG